MNLQEVMSLALIDFAWPAYYGFSMPDARTANC
jgi:hypothetical protein